MSELLLSAYVLVWPAVATAILVLLVGAVVKDHRDAKKAGREMV
jgi:hypothetical protein